MTIKIDSVETESYYPGDVIKTRYGHLSRGRSWGRLGTGSDVTWAPHDGAYVTLTCAGKWTVGSTDGFARKSQNTYDVALEPALVTAEQIAEIRAATTNSAVIEACDDAADGNADAHRLISRRYAEEVAKEVARVKAERKAARKARAVAEAEARIGGHSDTESIALDAEIDGRITDAVTIREERTK